MCADMYVDMYVDMCTDMWVDMFVHMSVDVCRHALHIISLTCIECCIQRDELNPNLLLPQRHYLHLL